MLSAVEIVYFAARMFGKGLGKMEILQQSRFVTEGKNGIICGQPIVAGQTVHGLDVLDNSLFLHAIKKK